MKKLSLLVAVMGMVGLAACARQDGPGGSSKDAAAAADKKPAQFVDVADKDPTLEDCAANSAAGQISRVSVKSALYMSQIIQMVDKAKQDCIVNSSYKPTVNSGEVDAVLQLGVLKSLLTALPPNIKSFAGGSIKDKNIAPFNTKEKGMSLGKCAFKHSYPALEVMSDPQKFNPVFEKLEQFYAQIDASNFACVGRHNLGAGMPESKRILSLAVGVLQAYTELFKPIRRNDPASLKQNLDDTGKDLQSCEDGPCPAPSNYKIPSTPKQYAPVRIPPEV